MYPFLFPLPTSNSTDIHQEDEKKIIERALIHMAHGLQMKGITRIPTMSQLQLEAELLTQEHAQKCIENEERKYKHLSVLKASIRELTNFR